MKRLLMMLALAGFAVACGDDEDDDDTKPPVDGGGKDAGPGTDGGPKADGGTDSGIDAGPPVICGGMTCTAHTAGTSMFAAGCAKNATNQDVCGLSSASLGGADAGLPPYLEKFAPGVASPSCGKFFDDREPANDGGMMKGNGRIDNKVMVGTSAFDISYPGCCTPKGFCSGETMQGMVLGMMVNGGFGCMDSEAFFARQPAAARAIPCNKTTGELTLPTADGGAGNVTDAGGVDAGRDI